MVKVKAVKSGRVKCNLRLAIAYYILIITQIGLVSKGEFTIFTSFFAFLLYVVKMLLHLAFCLVK